MLRAKTRSTLGRDLGGRLTPDSVAVERDEPAGRADAAGIAPSSQEAFLESHTGNTYQVLDRLRFVSTRNALNLTR